MFDSVADRVAERVEPGSLDDDALIAELIESHRDLARHQAHCVAVTAEIDRRCLGENAANTASLVAWQCKISKAEARLEVSNGRALGSMPEVAAAFAAGAITSSHVRLLAAAFRAAPDAFGQAVEELLDDARRPFAAFARSVAYFRQLADPDGTEEEAQDAFARRSAYCSQTFEDGWELRASLDPVGGSICDAELRRLERKLFEADWAEARARLGGGATKDDLVRTSAQRRADATVEMARRSATLGNTNLARPLFTVLVGYETIAGRICQLANGTVVTPGHLAPWLTDADIERVVFDGPSRVVDVGRRQRLFVGGTRRAVEVRDLECTEVTCDVPYDRCDVDHIKRWEDRGETVQANGRLRCPRHHRGRRRRP